jgi:hypothetical protein
MSMDYSKRTVMGVVDKYLALVRSVKLSAEEAERKRLEEEERAKQEAQAKTSQPKS